MALVMGPVCALIFTTPASASFDSRVTSGLVALYPLTEGSGDFTVDRSPLSEPIDLDVTGKLTWLSQTSGTNGVELNGGRIGHPHIDFTPSPPLSVIAALKATGHSTFEIWIQPEDLSTSGQPERMLSIGDKMMFGQQNANIQVWLLHTGKDANANPRFLASDSPLAAGLNHLVHTFDGNVERLYVNGVEHPTTVVASGDFSNWSDNGRMAFGHDTAVQPTDIYKGNSWNGIVRMVAVYDRALTPAEVTTNFAAGPDAPIVSAGRDLATQGLPGQPTQSVSLQGSVPSGLATALWTVESAPPGGIVTFGDDTSPTTSADFSVDGSYVLRLTASETGATAWDEVQVDVNVLSTAIPLAVNVAPADGATGVSLDPRLEIACETDATAARYVIATDLTFTTIAYDSGESELYYCAEKSFAGLAGSTGYAFSARVRDADGFWSEWSSPTEFTTADPARLATVSLKDGELGYAGAADVDIRGYSEDPANPNVVWNQGAQDVLRAGRRVDSTIENYRSLLRFDVSGLGEPEALIDAYIELTGWMHGAPSANDFVFEAPYVIHEVLVPWGEGSGITDPPAPGEASWLHSEEPTTWSVGGAGGEGTDRSAAALVRGALRNELDHQTRWSSVAFVDMVRGWLQSPAGNNGLLLEAEDELQPRTLKLGSRESPLAYRPRLVLEFQEPAEVVLTMPGVDFLAAGGSTTIAVEIRYADGTVVASDSATQVTFTPSGSAAVTAVGIGTGDGGYGTPGAAETVTVAGGVAEIVVANATPEGFTIAFSNDAGLADPPPDAIAAVGEPSQLVLTVPGSDFVAGTGTSLSLEVHDASGNLTFDDNSSQLIVMPSGSGAISGINVGTGDGGYGVIGGPEVVTVAGGRASFDVTNDVAQTFSVSFGNGAGLANPAPDSITVLSAAPDQVVVTAPGGDFTAGSSTNLSVAVYDAFGNLVTNDSSTQVTFAPTGSAAIGAVVTGVGDGAYGSPAGAETVVVSGGMATVSLIDTVAETFNVSFANDGGLSNPDPDDITVTPGAASAVALTSPGVDFEAGSSTPLSVAIQDPYGNLVTADSTTQVTFTPSGSANVSGVTTGTGDGGYGVAAAPETVTVAAGSATIILEDTVAESFTVSIANGAALSNPAPDEIDVAPAAPVEVVQTGAGADFVAGVGTAIAVALRDGFGNVVTTDAATQITFTPSGSGRITGVTIGSGDTSYGVPGGPESVSVSGGVAAVTVNDDVAESFDVTFSNGSGLVNPPPDEMVVSPGAPNQIGIAVPGIDFVAGTTTMLTIEVQDALGNRIDTDSTTQVTFTPSGSAFIDGVVAGTGDGSYGNPGEAEVVLVDAGFATVTLGDETAETVTVGLANDAGLVNDAPDSIEVDHAAASELLLAVAGADFVAGTGTNLRVEIRDVFGNLTTGDDATQLTFTPSGSAGINGVTTGTGDGSYGAPGASETVTVAAGIAAVGVTDTVAETFTVSFANDAGLTDPAADSIDVTPAAPSQVGVTIAGSDFIAGGGTNLRVAIQDEFGNLIPGDSTTQVTFTPTGGASVSGVVTGIGDGDYGAPAAAELVTVASGIAEILLEDTVAETFTVGFANDGAFANAAPDVITVSAAAAAQFVLVSPAPDFMAGAGSSLSVAIQDVYGNIVASDDTTQVAFSPSGNAAVTGVSDGTGDGSYGATAFPEIVTVAGGVAAITVNDTVSETFTVDLANDAGFANPPPDSITVLAATGVELVLDMPGSDFAAGGGTSLSLRVRDAFGNTVAQDDSTQLTLTPSGNAFVSGVTTGTGDGGYGVAGGAELVTVSSGVVTVDLGDSVAETFTVGFANDAGLSNPAPDAINVSPGAPSQLVLTLPGADFEAGAGTSLGVELQDALGNRILSDSSTQVVFSPSGGARIVGVTAGTGDGAYGVAAASETVTLASGAAVVALEDTVAETFTVSFANDAGVADPAADVIVVSPAEAVEVYLATPGADFDAGASTTLAIEIRDGFGNLISDDFGTSVTFKPSGTAFVSGVSVGEGDGTFGVLGGAETVIVAGGVASISLGDFNAETFTVAFDNGGALVNPPDDEIQSLGIPTQVPALGGLARTTLVLLLGGMAYFRRRTRNAAIPSPTDRSVPSV